MHEIGKCLHLHFFPNVILHTSHTLLSMNISLLENFMTPLQMLNIVILVFWWHWTNRYRTSIYLHWCIKWSWPQSIIGTMAFWFFMFIAVWRSWECFIWIYASAWSNHSLLWFTETNERLRIFICESRDGIKSKVGLFLLCSYM